MSNYNRKGLAHTRKVMTSSIVSSRPRHSLESLFPIFVKETRRKLSENFSIVGHPPSTLTIQELSSPNNGRLRNSQKNYDDKKVPVNFVSVSKPSTAIERLLRKRENDHAGALRNMRNELASSYATCEDEFRNRSISLKIRINNIRKEISGVENELKGIHILDLESKDYDLAWKRVSELIEDEKQFLDHFYNNLLAIEKKRQELSKSILQKYYKIFHKISFLLPYEIQVYFENEILNYNEAVLANHRVYADLNLQMNLAADAEKLRFKNFIEELKIDNREATEFNIY